MREMWGDMDVLTIAIGADWGGGIPPVQILVDNA